MNKIKAFLMFLFAFALCFGAAQAQEVSAIDTAITTLEGAGTTIAGVAGTLAAIAASVMIWGKVRKYFGKAG
ncbi:hypothetical protein H5P28_07060 [Ruficoccus amylovorans]|uniref:Uncharacterized protein n=1 Tax=Ruficoccus amylovorans TaxID=1804625 RepID=A0A842HD85_9BACT|nr:hypothetical protein [Ruficoccus amylovorans]MBC2594018.1 hypothetical protein [Ruficoccus amylovorans]